MLSSAQAQAQPGPGSAKRNGNMTQVRLQLDGIKLTDSNFQVPQPRQAARDAVTFDRE